jgi:hypothetical protein
MEALADVRARAEVVRALETLGDARALPTLVRWLPAEPYIQVRAAMAGLVAALAHTSEDRAAARAALEALAAVEREPPVRSAVQSALARLP